MKKKNKKSSSLLALLFILTVSSIGYWMMGHSTKQEIATVKVNEVKQVDSVLAQITPEIQHNQHKQIIKKHSSFKKAVIAKTITPQAAVKPNVDIVALDQNAAQSKLAPSDSSVFQAGSAEIKLDKETSDILWGIRLESLGSNANLFFDASYFPVKFSESLNGLSRFSLGMVQQNGGSSLALELGEQIFFKTSLPSINPYIGADINLLLSSGGSLGYGFFAGIERDVNLFGLKSEKAFFEIGYDSFSASDMTNSGFSFDLGYRFSF